MLQQKALPAGRWREVGAHANPAPELALAPHAHRVGGAAGLNATGLLNSAPNSLHPRCALYEASTARLQGGKVPGAISSWLRSGSTSAPKRGDWELLLLFLAPLVALPLAAPAGSGGELA